jgi:GDPmannose 4,6-dehydratase
MRALITGITGMDGSYLAEQLLAKNIEVFGFVRDSSSRGINYDNISHIKNDITLLKGDLQDYGSVVNAMRECKPYYVYNLAAQSHVGYSYQIPDETIKVTQLGAMNVFQAVADECPNAKVYQASTSEMFGVTTEDMQSELTPFRPISPYAIAKTAAHQMAQIWRSRGMFISCGILFNHESPRRGSDFLTSKVVNYVAESSLKHMDWLKLGNLDAIRDWGYAPEYVEGMIKMLDYNMPGDFVLATGVGHSVKEFVAAAFSTIGCNWNDFVLIDENLKRPIEAGPLVGNPMKAYMFLGWKARTSFHELVSLLVSAAIEKQRK